MVGMYLSAPTCQLYTGVQNLRSKISALSLVVLLIAMLAPHARRFFLSLLNNLKSAGARGHQTVRVTLSEEPPSAAKLLSPMPARDLMIFPDMVKLIGAVNHLEMSDCD